MTDFAADLAMLTKLGEIAEKHPELPDLVSRSFDDEGMHAVPWRHLRPVTALAAWVDALPGRWTVHAEIAPGGDGTQLTARGKLDGHALTLTTVTWRVEVVARPDGLVTREQLRHLAAGEGTTVAEELRRMADEAEELAAAEKAAEPASAAAPA